MSGTNAAKTARAKRRKLHKSIREYEIVRSEGIKVAAKAMALVAKQKASRGS